MQSYMETDMDCETNPALLILNANTKTCAVGKKYKVLSHLEQRNGNTVARNYSNNMKK